MAHFYESILIDTVDGFQCKSYANEHPEGFVIVKPKYIPKQALTGQGLRYRYLFEKCLVRFNLFARKDVLNDYLEQFRQKFPDYIYECPVHKNWFFVVPVNKIKTVHDSRKGLKELLSVPEKDMDEYLRLVKELVEFLVKSGVDSNNMGITHSTLLGNYTPGRSDIDIIIHGKENGWKILDFLKTAQHPLLRWKTEKEWRDYYQDHKTSESSHFTEDEYVKHASRKRYEGMFNGTVFTLFTAEEPNETWFKWGEETYQPLGTATIEGIVTDHYNCHVRPGFYEIRDGIIANFESNEKLAIMTDFSNGKSAIDKDKLTKSSAKEMREAHQTDEDLVIDKNIPIKRVVTYSIPFVQQALTGEKIKACGLLELVTPTNREKYYRVVIGYFDAYTNDRREKEFVKVVGNMTDSGIESTMTKSQPTNQKTIYSKPSKQSGYE
ncbi:MAG: hypothetical protein HZB65_02975 [Candidatus Aenigmarchaeota archaeon]|nr:hypothetical protein [Candidatus Aenigmarchaeota archaeon]